MKTTDLHKKAYLRYQMHWMLTHGITMDDISETVADWDKDHDYNKSFSKYVEEHGFWNGSLWACFDEFMGAEYQDKNYMKFLLPEEDFQLWLKEHGYGGKVYARQISPDLQESPLFYDELCFPDNIVVSGNSHYKEHLTDSFSFVKGALEYGELWEFTDITCNLPKKGGEAYSVEELNSVKSLIRSFNYTKADKDKIICSLLSIVEGESWDYMTIRGSVQSEWNTVYYPVNQWTDKALANFSMEYFNEGSEWIIHDEGYIPTSQGEISGYTTYCHYYNLEDIKKEIAGIENVDPADVILYPTTE